MLNLNPIVAREFAARWRGLRSFALLFFYSALLAGGMGFIYAVGNETQQAAERGRNLFQTLDWAQTVGWMLIAPALTATAIAGERERGLLEQVQLSPLSPWHIAWGKLQSALLLIGLMLLVPLPVIAICFFTGGVSPSEFATALALHAATATTCAAIGLLCSAWCRRSGTAMMFTFALVIVWNATSGIAFLLAEVGKSGGFNRVKLEDSLWALLDLSKTSWLWNALELYASSNPIYAALTLGQFSYRRGLGLAWWTWDIAPWLWCIIVQSCLTLCLLWLASLALRKPFAEQYWARGVGRHAKPKAKPPKPQTTETTVTPGVALGVATASADAMKELPRSTRWEFPGAARLGFTNPVLQRELRSKLRLRRLSPFVVCPGILLGAYGLYCYVQAVYNAFFVANWRTEAWWSYTGLALVALSFVGAISGAGAFTREREMGTHEPSLLSTLSSLEIAGGKLTAALLVCFACISPLTPLLLPNIARFSLAPQTDYGIAPLQALITILLLFATVWCYAIWGMLLSWLCKRTAVATVWTLGSLFALDVFIPALINDGSNSPWLGWNPFIVLSWLAGDYKMHHVPLFYSGLACVALLSSGGGLLALLIHLMRDAPRERDEHGPGAWLRQTL